MPSKLRRRAFFRSGQNSPQARASRILQKKFYVATQPWGGYTPDLNVSQLGPGDATETDAMVDHLGEIRQDFGWEEINADESPLGGTTPPVAAGSAEEVVGIFNYRDTSDVLVQFIVTHNEGSLGHMYEDTGSAWTHRAYTGTGTGVTNGFAVDLTCKPKLVITPALPVSRRAPQREERGI